MKKPDPTSPGIIGSPGFTLAEILIALLVFSLSALVLIALFPLAHSTEKSTAEETRAACIAANIMEALMSEKNPGTLRVAVGSSNGELLWESISPSNSGGCCIAYDATCQPRRMIPMPEATNPVGDQSTVALALVKFMPKRTTPELVTVEVVVASPPSAPEESRKSHRYVKLLAIP